MIFIQSEKVIPGDFLATDFFCNGGNGFIGFLSIDKFIADGYVTDKDIVDDVNRYTRNIIIRKDIVIDLDIYNDDDTDNSQ